MSSEELRTLLDAAVEALVVMNADGRILDWNRAAETTFGWRRQEALGAVMADLLVPEDQREAHRAGVERFLAGRGGGMIGRRVELRACHRDGHEVPVELTLSVLDAGERPRFAAFLHDISERKQAEARLRPFEAIVASSADAILSGSMDGTIESWNPAAERLYGYSAQEMIGSSVARLLPGGDFADVGAARQALFEGESASLQTRERRKDGTLVDVAVTMSPLLDERGETTGVVSVVRDVSERNQAAARLVEAHSRFAGAFEAAATGMALVGPDGRFLEVNPALCRLLASDPETLLRSSFEELTHPEDLAGDVAALERVLGGEMEGYQSSKRYLLPDGGIVWVLVTVTLVRDVSGVPLHLVAQIQDISDRKTAEGELRRYAAQLEALSEQDPLTGLGNRRTFEAALEEELRVLAAGGSAPSVLLAATGADERIVVGAAASLARASRDGDLVAHLGGGELAVLLPGVDSQTAPAIMQRAREALRGHWGVRCSHATACVGDSAQALVERARDARRDARGADAAGTPMTGSARVVRLLEFARRQLGMPVSFLTRLEGDDYVFARFSGEHQQFRVAPGDRMPLASTHCQRMLDGRIGSLVSDLAAEPHTRDLDVTTGLGLRAYAGVPVRLRSGEVYGTLCAVDTRPHPELSERHAELLRFLSALAAELIDDEAGDEALRRVEASTTGVRTLLVALEARDLYTSEHSKEVVALALSVARRLMLDEATIRDVEQVALLHDIGKVGIPDAILQKQGPLDTQEWQLMRQHPVVAERIIAGTPGLSHLAPAMRAEHERWDGGGYPDELAGEQIPLASRITLACDALHAMTSDRPYRPAMTLERANDELRSCAASQFDPRVIDALLAEIGSRAQLAAHR